MQIDRRQLIYGSGAALGFPFISSFVPSTTEAQSSTTNMPARNICPNLANYMNDGMSQLIRSFHAGSVQPNDMRRMADRATLYGRHLETTGFDSALKPLIASFTPGQNISLPSSLVDQATAVINGDEPYLTSDTLNHLLPVTPAGITNSIKYTRANGLAGHFRDGAGAMRILANEIELQQKEGTWTGVSPVAYHSEQMRAHLRRICSAAPPSHSVSPQVCGLLFDAGAVSINAVLAILLLGENEAALVAVLAALGFLTATGLIIFVAALTIGLLIAKLGCG